MTARLALISQVCGCPGSTKVGTEEVLSTLPILRPNNTPVDRNVRYRYSPFFCIHDTRSIGGPDNCMYSPHAMIGLR